MPDPDAPYTIASKTPIIATQDVKVTLMAYAPGQEVPWHSHTTVTDTTFCLEGSVELAVREADGERAELLAPGDHRQVAPGVVHRVRCLGPGPCRALLVQGVGAYDFNPA